MPATTPDGPPPASAAFTPLERAALGYADAMTATPVEGDAVAAALAALRPALDDPQVVELTAAIAHENLRSRMNHALGYGAEGFNADGVCALPARRGAEIGARPRSSDGVDRHALEAPLGT